MALRAMYKGIKKVLAPLIINRPGELAIDQDALNTELDKVFLSRSEDAVTGAINFFDSKSASSSGSGITFTANVDESVSMSAGTASTECYFGYQTNKLPVGKKAWAKYGDTAIANLRTQVFYKATEAGDWSVLANVTGNVAEFTVPNSYYLIWVRFSVAATKAVSASTLYPQISLSVNAPYASYAMTNKELMDLGLVYRGVIPAGASLDDYVECGMWDINGTNPTGLPTGASGYVPLIVLPRWGRGNIKQIIISRANEIYLRNKNDGESWSSWYKFTGTEVT